uniref:Uncharacterized protein n=1 Tax=Lactuca sativa TaxID=4236 RepID=A0A9R1X3Z2_LACSA|nr:hypothetical protein LSAT_V11C700343140 [Lactuca sativa]
MRRSTETSKVSLLTILYLEGNVEVAISLWKECTDIPEKFNRGLIESTTPPTVLAITNVKVIKVDGIHILFRNYKCKPCANKPINPRSDKSLTQRPVVPGDMTHMQGDNL